MIHTRGLARRFRAKKETVEAVTGIDLDVAPGELVAFLGPNGAGKSTTVRMLTTLLRPTSGTARVAGHDVVADPTAVRQHIGYIGQGNGAGNAYKVRDELISQARFYGMPTSAARQRCGELLESLNLAELAGRAVASLSGGQKRRLDIAMGMVHRPKLLFLDEPSTGLDPQNRANLAEQIHRLRSRFGMTVFLTTHYLDEADQLAERVLIIDGGSVIAEGSPAELKATLAGDRITLVLNDSHDTASAARSAEGVGATRGITVDGDTVEVTAPDGPRLLPRLLYRLQSEGITVSSTRLAIPTLDDVFLALTGRTLRDSDT